MCPLNEIVSFTNNKSNLIKKDLTQNLFNALAKQISEFPVEEFKLQF